MMANWIMPHEMDEAVKVEVNPVTAKSKWIMPHEVEAAKTAEKTPEEKLLEEASPGQRALIGAGSRFHKVGQGIRQTAGTLGNTLGIQNTIPEEVAAEVRAEKPVTEAIQKSLPASLGVGATDLALGLLTPSTRVLPAMGAGFALEGPLTPRENPTWGNLLQEGGKGAALSGAGSLAVNGALTSLAKAKNATQGRFASPIEERRFRIFRQNEVPGSLGDITQNPTVMQLENMAQHIPFTGRKEFLERQADTLAPVVEGAPAKIAGITPAQSKEDIGAVVAKSIKDKYKEVKGTARSMYDDVQARVQSVGNPPVIPAKMSTEVNNLLNKYPSAFAKLGDDPDTIRTLEIIRTGVQPGKSPILGANGQPILTPPNLTFAELRQLDSDLGAMIRQGRQLSARGEYNSKTFEQLTKVQKALRDDITDWSHTIGDPEIANGVAQANQYFRNTVVPFRKNGVVRKVIQDENYNPDQLPNSFFKLDSPYLATKATEFMTPEGIQAGRFHLLNQAKQRAMNDVLESGYSPSKFMRGTELGETGPKLFTPGELGQLSDLQELVGSSRRAASYATDPSTGNRLLGLAGLVSAKLPLLSRAFSTATTSETPMRVMLADPRLYTGSGPLGQAGEALLRKTGIGAPLNFVDITNAQ